MAKLKPLYQDRRVRTVNFPTIAEAQRRLERDKRVITFVGYMTIVALLIIVASVIG